MYPYWLLIFKSIRMGTGMNSTRPKSFTTYLYCVCLVLCVAFPRLAVGQERLAPGKSIGKISTGGDLIVMELDEGALGSANLFDLAGRTLRFAPSGGGYRVQNLPLKWDGDFGSQLERAEVTLHDFWFPFSGKKWDSFSVGTNGSIRFGAPQPTIGEFAGLAARQGGVSIGRFDQLAEAASSLINTVPAICVFLKPRMSGSRYIRTFADHALITWDVTEPWGNIQDFTWTKTINRFQAVLWQDGTIAMSYQQLAAKDAIIGLYPPIAGGAEQALATLTGHNNSSGAAHRGIPTHELPRRSARR